MNEPILYFFVQVIDDDFHTLKVPDYAAEKRLLLL